MNFNIIKMKYLILLKMFSCSLLIFAQNLVPNGGFEMGTYNGGSNPIGYYSATIYGFNQSGPDRFDEDMDETWYVAKPASGSKDSPDWMTGTAPQGGSCGNHTSKYVRSARANESIMCEINF
jgi:hypothetical protein